jgi:two-component system alkaline phosphatase synthesis response regulator PhoP
MCSNGKAMCSTNFASMDFKEKIILIADDEPDILEIVSFNLQQEGYSVYTAKDGNEAIEKAQQINPHLIILDIMMPYKNGVEVCKILRAQPKFKDTLIIFLTALSDETTHIKGLDTGADDYVTKPISPRVLVSRVHALFRRTTVEKTDIITAGNITINATNYNVEVDGQPVVLAKKEFELLYLLAAKPGRVFLRNEILEQVWGNEVIVGDRTIDVHIRKIRQKLGVNCISTLKGVGYKFDYMAE